MLNEIIDIERYLVKPGKKIELSDYATEYTDGKIEKSQGEELLDAGKKKLAAMQDKLYAHDKYSLLIIFQAMDAAGKDSAVKHIMSGLNPSGVQVHSFKAPSIAEIDHDYMWRHYIALPGRGMIGIFNRSHYENVLVTRVHPEMILKEKLPSINAASDIDEKFWESRFKQIKRFEKNINQNGTIILKFFLHVSAKEQKKRFIERIDNHKKHWKFSPADANERLYWDDYQMAYQNAISNTSTEFAPWYIIPADDKWFTRLAIINIIYEQFESMDLEYPEVNGDVRTELLKIKDQLLAEGKV
ncbi:MAG: polyphosphate kinase 2 family protein [Ignavibacteria bacterium]